VIKSLSYRKLGSSDLRVSPIGLGCWQFSKGQGVSLKLTADEMDSLDRASALFKK